VEVAFVVVALVPVALVNDKPPLNAISVVVALLGKRYENELPLENVRHMLFTEKHPLERLIPLANVEVAVPVWLKFKRETFPENVEVPEP